MTPDVRAAIERHNLHDPRPHTNLVFEQCTCAQKPVGMDGPTCVHCGGMTKRNGTCATCISCGETTGCG